MFNLWCFINNFGMICFFWVNFFNIFLLVEGVFLGVFFFIGKLSFLNKIFCSCFVEVRLNFCFVVWCIFVFIFVKCCLIFWDCVNSFCGLINILLCLICESICISGILILLNSFNKVGVFLSFGNKVWCNFIVIFVFFVVYLEVIFNVILLKVNWFLFLFVIFLNVMVLCFK